MAARATPRVLLVDDYDGLLYAWRRLLADSCNVVGAVTSGREAIAAVASLSPDVVVIDRLLADCDGIDLCSEIVALAPSTRVVVVSASYDAALPEVARRAGAFAYVSKSMAGEDLEKEIQRAFIGDEEVA
jgi:DNA-binding NarL/FixJ family response regulator